MSVFFWNIRGFNKSNKQKVVCDWLQNSSLQFGGLLETRVKASKAPHIFKSVFKDWDMVSNYEFNRLGRIWVVWSKRVKMQVVFKSGQMITCLAQVESMGEEFLVSVIYASNFEDERKVLWRDIKNLQDSKIYRGKPWICFGDFNETLDFREHSRADISPMVMPGMRDFQDMVRHCSLIDLRSHGPLFTWCNKRVDGLICKKLDRVLVNMEWQQVFPQSYCKFEAGGCSDHLRGRILLESEILRPRGPFKFTNAIASQPEFLKKVEDFWQRTAVLHHSTSALFRFCKKLKELKPILKDLSRNKLSNLSRRTADAYDDLCACQQNSLLHPNSQVVEIETQAYQRWEKVATLKESYLRQKAKLHWMKIGDKNNKYFHNAVRERKAINTIHEITSPTGESITNASHIKEEAVSFFSTLLSHQPPDFTGISVDELRDLLHYRCSMPIQEKLIADVTETEIKKVIISMPTNKAPGPDGYTVEFFREGWSIVGKELIVAIQSFFQFGFLPKGLNSTILALIPKKLESKEMKDYRPISCCNVIYKTISKILANRLKSILADFIAPNQSAFIEDRMLMENLLLATELVRDYHKDGVSTRCAMKIDISKAFDSVQWSFMLNVLTALNLPSKFIHWIKRCVTMASFSVQVNGELAGYFQSERGLR